VLQRVAVCYRVLQRAARVLGNDARSIFQLFGSVLQYDTVCFSVFCVLGVDVWSIFQVCCSVLQRDM